MFRSPINSNNISREIQAQKKASRHPATTRRTEGEVGSWFVTVRKSWKLPALSGINDTGWEQIWLVVSTHLKNISQIGSSPQVRMNIKNVWNHHLEIHSKIEHVNKLHVERCMYWREELTLYTCWNPLLTSACVYKSATLHICESKKPTRPEVKNTCVCLMNWFMERM